MSDDSEKIKVIRFRLWLSLGAVVILFVAWACRPSLNNYNPQSAWGESRVSFNQIFLDGCEKDAANCEMPSTVVDKEKWQAERSDLAAQWAMSDTAHIAFFAGLIGIGFIFLTLIETQEAARSAKSATEAAWVAANSDRAWLLHTMKGDGNTPQCDFGYHGLYDFKDERGAVEIINGAWAKIATQNFGNSPAQMIGYSVSCAVVEDESEVPTFNNLPFIEIGEFIPPGGIYFSPKIPISLAEKNDFITFKKFWFIYYKVVYKTTSSGEEKVSEFCFQFKALKHNVDSQGDRFLLENIIYVPRGVQNRVT